MKELIWGLIGSLIAICFSAFLAGGWLIEKMGGVNITQLQALCPTHAGSDEFTTKKCFDDYRSHEHQSTEHVHDEFVSVSTASSHIHEDVGEHTHTSSELSSGAVIAFDLNSGCPDGWTDLGNDPATRARFAGRTLIAMGPAVGRSNNQSTSERKFNAQNGTENVSLTEPQMPKHRHRLPTDGVSTGTDTQSLTNTAGTDEGIHRTQRVQFSGFNGSAQAHNNMPPYIALYFCKKD